MRYVVLKLVKVVMICFITHVDGECSDKPVHIYSVYTEPSLLAHTVNAEGDSHRRSAQNACA